MATYAIGDIQGCYDPLQRLLERVRFDPAVDRLWFAGDLVNRGPHSLEVLRFVRDLGEGVVTVLGNHDLHLLAVWHHRDRLKHDDSLTPVLRAPDAEALIDWLRRRPLLHHDEALGFTLVHAGLSPQWDRETAFACAAEVEATLRGPDYEAFLDHMYGNRPKRWSGDLSGWERLRYAVNCFTRLRFCDPDGTLELKQKGTPGPETAPYLPWFQVPGRAHHGLRVVFGHWSTLGLHLGEDVYGIDTGCLWGGRLTALRLDAPEPTPVSVACPALRAPR